MSVHNNSSSASAGLHHHHHHPDQACHHHHQQQQHQYHHHSGEERQSGRRASRGGGVGGPAADVHHPPPPPPPPPPHPPALDVNGADTKTEDNEESPGLDGPMTTTTTGQEVTTGQEITTGQEVTYIDDDDDDDIAAAEIQVDRDPFKWNEIIKVKFDDIFGEPDSEIFSFESVWKISSKVYRTTKLWCYRLLSVTFVVPLAVLWGILFSCLSFSRVWICVPLLKASDIQLHCIRRLFEALLRTFLAPCFEAVGRCLYHIRLRIIRGDESL